MQADRIRQGEPLVTKAPEQRGGSHKNMDCEFLSTVPRRMALAIVALP